MKKNHLILLFCMVTLFFACESKNEPDGELITVKLSPSFITIAEDTDVPMSAPNANAISLVDTNQVIYAVQAYEDGIEYYYGLFDGTDNMEIPLMTGKTYQFHVAVFKVGTGKGLKQTVESDGTYLYLPSKIKLGNKFIKGNALNNINKVSSITLNTNSISDYPEIDAFYCSKSVTVEKGLSNIEMNMLRMGFGAALNVDGLTDGQVNVIMGNDTIVLTEANPSKTSIRLFDLSTDNLLDIFNTANTFSDSILIQVEWIGSGGSSLNMKETFAFKRNYQKTINIQLNTSELDLTFEDWGNNTVTDIDGNVYKTVTIGTQVWMAENLRVNHYRDGNEVPNVTDSLTWGSLTSGAWCNYANLEENGKKYGHLYNWYTISNIRNVAPEGWHVPTKNEWTTLITYLGGFSVAGGKMKEEGTTNWKSPNYGATNSSGFTALPGGIRWTFWENTTNHIGMFLFINTNTDFWTATEINSSDAWDYSLLSSDAKINELERNKRFGFYIRCVKD